MQTLIDNNQIQTYFSVKTDWEQGFTGRLDIFNTGELVEDWTIEFESEFEIEPGMIWGAEIVSHEGERYVLKPVDFNQSISSDGSTSIFFNANKINGEILEPTNVVFDDGNSSVIDTTQTELDSAIAEKNNSDEIDSEVLEEALLEEVESDSTPEKVIEPTVDEIKSDLETKEVESDSTPEKVIEPTVDEIKSDLETKEVESDSTPESVIEPTVDEIEGDRSSAATETEAELEADVDFTLVKDWGSGYQGKISITNNTGGNIDSWSLEFDFPNPINDIWDAEIEENQDGSYVISHANWNREIAAGETLTFGFTGENSVTTEPQNFDLDGTVFNSASRSDSIYTFENPDLAPELELNQEYQGRATFYDAANPAGGLGASGYDVPIQSELHKVVAINNIQWNGSEASGAFFEVSGPKQRDGAAPITVQVVDYLYERADGFDMSAEAFAKVADPVDGVVNIEYTLVGPGDDYVTAYGYSIGQGIVVEGIAETNPYYAAVRLNNHRYPIESVDLLTDGGSTVELERESDNRFVLEGNYPLYGAQDLLVTDIFGQEVILDDVNITNGSNADTITGEQFEMI